MKKTYFIGDFETYGSLNVDFANYVKGNPDNCDFVRINQHSVLFHIHNTSVNLEWNPRQKVASAGYSGKLELFASQAAIGEFMVKRLPEITRVSLISEKPEAIAA